MQWLGPFPTFPRLAGVWGDAGNYRAGTWIGGKGPPVAPRVADPAPPTPSTYPTLPTLPGLAAEARYRPVFSTRAAGHVSGREGRAAGRAAVRWEVTLGVDLLRAGEDALAGFFNARQGRDGAFLVPAPAALGAGASLLCRFADDVSDFEELMDRLRQVQAITLVGVPG